MGHVVFIVPRFSCGAINTCRNGGKDEIEQGSESRLCGGVSSRRAGFIGAWQRAGVVLGWVVIGLMGVG